MASCRAVEDTAGRLYGGLAWWRPRAHNPLESVWREAPSGAAGLISRLRSVQL
jgi:hypothetical protein